MSSLAGGGSVRGAAWRRALLVATLAVAATRCGGAPPDRRDSAHAEERAATDLTPAPPPAPTSAVVVPTPPGRPCVDLGPTGTIRVSVDSIGGLPSRMTLAQLRARCPGARDTVVGDYEYAGPAVVIPAAPGATIVAGQSVPMIETDSSQTAGELRAEKPIDYWTFAGPAIELPGGLRGSARWGELIRRYGPALIVTELSDLRARFCRLPDFGFLINGYDHGGARDNFETVDTLYSVISAEAPISEIWVRPDGPQGSAPDPARCRGSSPS